MKRTFLAVSISLLIFITGGSYLVYQHNRIEKKYQNVSVETKTITKDANYYIEDLFTINEVKHHIKKGSFNYVDAYSSTSYEDTIDLVIYAKTEGVFPIENFYFTDSKAEVSQADLLNMNGESDRSLVKGMNKKKIKLRMQHIATDIPPTVTYLKKSLEGKYEKLVYEF
ncbi:hypothetical protein IGI37_003718 [Enterococcus sp. AZ194]|uniref:hypothetical protein n=1 Tax=Enterococcus sp. AZ194 TaxID=2774629 RepID=UPI003F1FAC9C